MTIKIINKAGPMLENEYSFPANVHKITVGRNPDSCEVLYPPEFDTVGRTHLAITEDVGRFEIRVNKDNPAFVNGKPALDDQEIASGDSIALGSKDGPSFIVEYQDTSGLPPTKKYRQQKEIHQQVGSLGKGLIAVALLALVGGGWFFSKQSTLENQLQNAKSQMSEALSESYEDDSLDIGAKANAGASAVYLVLVKSESGGEDPVGTAWVSGPQQLATNAHVADIYNDIQEIPELSLIVRSPSTYEDHKVESITIHPGYEAFEEAWLMERPMMQGSSGETEAIQFVPGYDVAYLNVGEQSQLGKALKVADATSLKSLKPGSQVAFIGYPTENLNMQDFKSPTPTIQIANITSVVDFFRSRATTLPKQLIQHSLPATGGASGSPIINKKGEVVALLNAGNVIFTGDAEGNLVRLSHGADINYAQRADLLKGLDGSLDISALQQSWQEGFERFLNEERAIAAVIPRLRQELLEQMTEFWAVREGDRTLTSKDKIEFDISYTHTFEDVPVFEHVFNAKASDILGLNAISATGRDIDMFVLAVDAEGMWAVERDTADDFYPTVTFKVPQDGRYLLLVADQGLTEGENSEGELWIYKFE